MGLDDLEAKVAYLLDRQQIYDVIASYARGVDRLDRDVLESVYHEDALDDHTFFVGNRHEFWKWVHGVHSNHHHSSNHFIGNHLVDIQGDVAHAETYFMFASMNKAGAPFSFAGGRYIDRLEKRAGKWAIVDRYCITDFAAPSINRKAEADTDEGKANFNFAQAHEWLVANAGSRGAARDSSDPSYDRPLRVRPERRQACLDARLPPRNDP
jgi:hypothetical protein